MPLQQPFMLLAYAIDVLPKLSLRLSMLLSRSYAGTVVLALVIPPAANAYARTLPHVVPQTPNTHVLTLQPDW
jgi:hypothetical protein